MTTECPPPATLTNWEWVGLGFWLVLVAQVLRAIGRVGNRQKEND